MTAETDREFLAALDYGLDIRCEATHCPHGRPAAVWAVVNAVCEHYDLLCEGCGITLQAQLAIAQMSIAQIPGAEAWTHCRTCDTTTTGPIELLGKVERLPCPPPQ